MNNFQVIKIRVCAIVQIADEILLIHRIKNGQSSYTLPGGNVDDGEDIKSALERELKEELNIKIDNANNNTHLVGVQDQMVSRPGKTPPPRKIHFIFRTVIHESDKYLITSKEVDEIGEGNMIWIKINDACSLHLYPAIGSLLKHPSIQPISEFTPQLLPPMNDTNFTWI